MALIKAFAWNNGSVSSDPSIENIKVSALNQAYNAVLRGNDIIILADYLSSNNKFFNKWLEKGDAVDVVRITEATE